MEEPTTYIQTNTITSPAPFELLEEYVDLGRRDAEYAFMCIKDMRNEGHSYATGFVRQMAEDCGFEEEPDYPDQATVNAAIASVIHMLHSAELLRLPYSEGIRSGRVVP